MRFPLEILPPDSARLLAEARRREPDQEALLCQAYLQPQVPAVDYSRAFGFI